MPVGEVCCGNCGDLKRLEDWEFVSASERELDRLAGDGAQVRQRIAEVIAGRA